MRLGSVIGETRIMLRMAWQMVERTDRDGDRCFDCELCLRTPERNDEPATRECSLLYTGDDPYMCPGVDADYIRDSIDAMREEYEDSRHDK